MLAKPTAAVVIVCPLSNVHCWAGFAGCVATMTGWFVPAESELERVTTPLDDTWTVLAPLVI
jgi:hypothetical protein